ncbi:beta-ketoacyl-ACP synthase 3 [Tahibacter amnicola]|uniref:Beta-ketoacyl-ACP synthase 3 n=1 Tax=Tahibacter amnicola TaxID=2976241 RepID=A0ABY6BB86_9GAMM|nr:beta-ketoacyl-ACP synthase 3 [Tahibacter amnicola]UXI67124.1 beta-ketoacyl-ACP synthase 3 [Tahibacter amnicola]
MVHRTAPLPIRILGTGEYTPAVRVASHELDARWGRPQGWTFRHSGISHRHYAGPDETTSSMAALAARSALAAAGLTASDMDCIVSASSVMEQAIPCTAVLVQRRLGLEGSGIPAFDINATCLGFLAALDTVGAALAIGRYRRVLVVCGEMASAGLRADDPETAMLFGDGAAAVVLGRDGGGESQVLNVRLETYSEGADLCQVRAGGTRLKPSDGRDDFLEGAYFEMNGRATYRLAAQRFPAFVDRLLGDAGVTCAQLRQIVPHQASAKALAHMEAALKLPAETFVRVLATRGNQMAASIPIALHHAISSGKIARGDLVALLGTGAGLSFGGAVLRY